MKNETEAAVPGRISEMFEACAGGCGAIVLVEDHMCSHCMEYACQLEGKRLAALQFRRGYGVGEYAREDRGVAAWPQVDHREFMRPEMTGLDRPRGSWHSVLVSLGVVLLIACAGGAFFVGLGDLLGHLGNVLQGWFGV